VADLRTTISEVVTGLGMLEVDDIEHGLSMRPSELVNVTPADWDLLSTTWTTGRHRDVYVAAFMNGRAFVAADDALRGRPPRLVEWKGAHRAPGDEVVPADLRVDHVYLVSCKYLSRIVVNASPHHLFERLLAGGQGRRTGADWFAEVAPDEYDALFEAVRGTSNIDGLPGRAGALTKDERRALAVTLRGSWPSDDAAKCYRALVERVAGVSAERWRASLDGHAEALLWRMLRIGSAPYFVLGASGTGFVRLRIATPWDWRMHFQLRQFDVEARALGQPVVAWRAIVRERGTAIDRTVEGHVEIRWSHGRFGGPPEAKVYLDTPHVEIPGYFPLQ
jgi:hypothetical protein